jgi:hypothetical protein
VSLEAVADACATCVATAVVILACGVIVAAAVERVDATGLAVAFASEVAVDASDDAVDASDDAVDEAVVAVVLELPPPQAATDPSNKMSTKNSENRLINACVPFRLSMPIRGSPLSIVVRFDAPHLGRTDRATVPGLVTARPSICAIVWLCSILLPSFQRFQSEEQAVRWPSNIIIMTL